ncbi:hypothetical protein FRC05_004918 [Tulasnella sp. 425]|nr:hypothetical protein FRC05_004918 [Tulasnella sp. 425]
MENERDSADIPRSVGPDPSGSRSGFKPSAKLRARMERLEKWRIHPSSIKSPEDAREFRGGHATVSKAFLLADDDDDDDDGKDEDADEEEDDEGRLMPSILRIR